MKTLASASFAYLLKFIWFIFLALAINITLAIVYWGSISSLFSFENVWVGSITLITLLVFPIVWVLVGKGEALRSAIFKVVNKHLKSLVEFIIETFVTENSRDRLGDYTGILKKQSFITRMILEFFFEKIDFFTDVSELLKEKDYTNKELSLKMVERIEEKALFEEWEPSFITPLFLATSNIGIVYLVNYFL